MKSPGMQATVLMAIILSQILSSIMPALLQQISTAPNLDTAASKAADQQTSISNREIQRKQKVRLKMSQIFSTHAFLAGLFMTID